MTATRQFRLLAGSQRTVVRVIGGGEEAAGLGSAAFPDVVLGGGVFFKESVQPGREGLLPLFVTGLAEEVEAFVRVLLNVI